MNEENSRAGFCSAPWTDCIAYADGALKACDRNAMSFGDWQTDGLKNTWNSEAFQEFRRKIHAGEYPNEDCASCHNNGTQRTAQSSLAGAYYLHYRTISDHFGKKFRVLKRMFDLFHFRARNNVSDRHLKAFFRFLDLLERYCTAELATNSDLRLAVVKMRVIGEALEDYLNGELKPRRVATFRQAQLQAKCTARCVMCAGKYTGEIVSGPTMDEARADEAFANPEDISDFWCNGAEYLFYKDWKKVALMLAHEGVKMRVSTNGILLNEDTIRFMIDNKILRFITLSLDAATKETLESTRINVNFDKVMSRLRFLLAYAHERNYYFELTCAFVLMKRNVHELPDFVRLIHSLRPPGSRADVTVLCQPLENFDIPGYREFIHGEHHTLVGEEKLRQIFLETFKVQNALKLRVSFYNQRLDHFIVAGMPIPRFFPRQSDVDIITASLTVTKQKADVLYMEIWREIGSLLSESGHDRAKLRACLYERFDRTMFGSAVVQATAAEFPKLREALDEVIAPLVERVLKNIDRETAECGPVLCVYWGHAMLCDGTIFPAGSLHRFTGAGGALYLRVLCFLYAAIHELKRQVFGNRRSLLLWKVSVAYRALFKKLGVRVPVLSDHHSQDIQI